MAELSSVLARIPGLGGYLAQDQMNRQSEQGELAQLARAMQIKGQQQQMAGQAQARADDQALQGVVSQAGGDPAKAIQALLAAGTPKSIELASKLKGLVEKPQAGQQIGSGGLLKPDGTIVPPAARPDVSKTPTPSNLGRLIAERDALPEGDPRRAAYDAAIKRDSEGKPENERPYYQPLQTAQGIFRFNARTGKVEKIDVEGKPVVGSASDPALQGGLAAAKAGGKVAGTAQAQAVIDLPKVEQQTNTAVRLLDELVNHPGKKMAVGAASALGLKNLPGSPAASFNNRLKQIEGQQFLAAFETLKGGGQITEIEGQKATQAIARMQASNSIAEFDAAVRDYKEVLQAALARTKARAGGAAPAPAAPAIAEGQTATGPDGQKIVFRNGQWQPTQ